MRYRDEVVRKKRKTRVYTEMTYNETSARELEYTAGKEGVGIVGKEGIDRRDRDGSKQLSILSLRSIQLMRARQTPRSCTATSPFQHFFVRHF